MLLMGLGSVLDRNHHKIIVKVQTNLDKEGEARETTFGASWTTFQVIRSVMVVGNPVHVTINHPIAIIAEPVFVWDFTI